MFVITSDKHFSPHFSANIQPKPFYAEYWLKNVVNKPSDHYVRIESISSAVRQGVTSFMINSDHQLHKKCAPKYVLLAKLNPKVRRDNLDF